MFSVYEKELIIGEIFVRVYNDQPSYPLEVRKLNIKFSNRFRQLTLFIIRSIETPILK